jgi:dephospho-CoA kinase
MPPVHLFGLTGGIASGKSAVARRLGARGVPVIDADLLAREAVSKGAPALSEIARIFGPDVLAADGSLDRKRVAALVFGDDEKRRRLNAILHPRISELTMQRAAQLRDRGEPLACYEAALLVENGVADAFRPLVVVAAPEELQIARAGSRDGISPEEVRARIRAQVPLAEKIASADHVIENQGSLAELARRTDEVLTAICTGLGIDVARYPEASPAPGSDKLGHE